MADTISVPYTIFVDDGITESNPPDGATARVIFKCLWDDHYQLIKDLMWSASRSGGQLIRVFGYPYPPSPNLVCTSIESVKPLGKPYLIPKFGLPWLTKKYTLVTAIFTAPKFGADASTDASGQPFTSTQVGVSGEFLTVPETSYVFDSDGAPTNAPIGILMPQVEITFKRHWMPYLPIFEMLTLAGKVNNAAFTIGVAGKQFTCATGTLLFLGGPNDIQTDSQGNITQEVEYKFVYRPVPWNKYLHPKKGTGFDFVSDGSGNRPYQFGDFTILP